MTSSQFAASLQAALDENGVSLNALSAQCKELGTPVSVATLSYWLKGDTYPRRRNSLAVVENIEYLLHLAPGSLTSVLEIPSVSSPDRSSTMESYIPSHPSIDQLRKRWSFPVHDGLSRLFMGANYTFFPDRSHLHYRLVLRAERNRADRILFTRMVPKPDDRSDRFNIIAGAMTGRVEVVDRHMLIQEMVFPRPLAKDEIAVLEFEHWGHATGDSPVNPFHSHFELFASKPVDVLSLRLEFLSGDRPREVAKVIETRDDEGKMRRRRTVVPMLGTTVQATAGNVDLGRVRLEWD